jgi:hypothetical protein
MDDDPPSSVEYLDEWDPPAASRRRSAGNGRMLLLLAVVLVVAVVIAVSLGAAQRRLVSPVTSSAPATPTPTSIPPVTTPATAGSSDVTYTTVDATIIDQTPDPLPSDAETEPLTIKLLDKVPKEKNGFFAYRVSVCVNSTAVGGGKVRIRRDGWYVSRMTSGASGPTDASQIDPAFPVDALYGKGQCATGYVTFAREADQPIAIGYSDGRSDWAWRLV